MKTRDRAKNSKKGMTVSFIILLISVVLFFGLLFLGFTRTAYNRVIRGDAAFVGLVPFANLGAKQLFLTINGAKDSVFASFFINPTFNEHFSYFGYIAYGILALTLIIIIIQICIFVKRDKKGMIAWIIPTLLIGLLGVEICLLGEHFIGLDPTNLLAGAKGMGYKRILLLDTVEGAKDRNAIVYIYAAILYSFALVCVVLFISALATLIAPIVYAARAPKVLKEAKKDELNAQGEFAPNDLQPNEFEENVNNLNTIGTTSPLVVQYINSYGEQNTQSTPKKAVADDEYLTKADVKDLLKEILTAIKEEKAAPANNAAQLIIHERPLAEEVKEEKPAVVAEPVVEPEPVVVPTPVVEVAPQPAPVIVPAPVVEPEPVVEEVEEPEEPEDVFANLVDDEGNQVEVLSADDLKTFIQCAVTETLEAKAKEDEAKAAAIKEAEATINEPKETIGYDDEQEEIEEPVVKTEEPALNHTIVVAVPADYKEEPEVVEEEAADAVESIDEVRDIIAEEIKEAFRAIKNVPASKPQPKPAPAPVKVEPQPEPTPVVEVKPEPAPAPVKVEVKPEPKPAPRQPVRNDVRGSETVVERGEVIRLNFLEKVASGSKDLIKNYNAIKNLLMSFGLKDRLSNSADTFRLHKNTYAKITTNGDAIKLFLALDPKDFMSTALPIQDMSNKAAYKEIPLAIKVKSELSLRRATELIYACMRENQLEQIEGFDMEVDYVKLVRKELKKIENSKR